MGSEVSRETGIDIDAIKLDEFFSWKKVLAFDGCFSLVPVDRTDDVRALIAEVERLRAKVDSLLPSHEDVLGILRSEDGAE